MIAQKAKVLFDFTAQAANQISLKAGQIITITANGGKGGWSKGVEEGTGKCQFLFSVKKCLELCLLKGKMAIFHLIMLRS